MRRRQLLVAAPALLGIAMELTARTEPVVAAMAFGSPGFAQTWQRDEARVSGFWGDLSGASESLQEANDDAPGGMRLVQYFNSGRMEQTVPGGPVTSGLLVRELITGTVSLGGRRTQSFGPATLRLFGTEADENPAYPIPTFADLAALPKFAEPGKTPLAYAMVRGHQWQPLSGYEGNAQNAASSGEFSGYVRDPSGTYQQTILDHFQDFINDKLAATIAETIGYPITPIAVTQVAGDTYVCQAFERRLLAQVNTRTDAYLTIQGTGALYYNWRYVGR